MNYPQYILDYIGDTIFPKRCVGCGSFSTVRNREYLCITCLGSIPVKNNFECIGCNKNTPFGKTCFECQEFNAIDNLLIVSNYNNPLVEKIIKTMKYRFIQDLIKSTQPLIKKYIIHLTKYKKFNLIKDNPLIIPVPLHPRRLNWRGFNQAELIAKVVANITQLEIRNGVLSRVKYSKPQADISKKEMRLKSMANKFSFNPDENISNRLILLIDDICTTGATLDTAAKVLKDNGAKKVIAFVIARG